MLNNLFSYKSTVPLANTIKIRTNNFTECRLQNTPIKERDSDIRPFQRL